MQLIQKRRQTGGGGAHTKWGWEATSRSGNSSARLFRETRSGSANVLYKLTDPHGGKARRRGLDAYDARGAGKGDTLRGGQWGINPLKVRNGAEADGADSPGYMGGECGHRAKECLYILSLFDF